MRKVREASMRPQRVSCGICRSMNACYTKAAASMRPQRVSCGIPMRPQKSLLSRSGFNEAAACQLRNLNQSEGVK